jgi:outer membrane protein assembly factor BamB
MQAFTAATGKSVFATARGGQQSPVVTGGHLYASVTDVVHTGLGVVVVDYLATFNATDGGEQFVDTTGHFGRPSAPAVANGVLYATDGALEVYDAAGVTNCGPQYAPPEAQGHVFAPQWCGPLWTGSPAGSEVLPAVANRSVYVAGGAGTLSIFAAGGCGATTCSPRWTGNAGSQPLAPPAVTASSVFVGSNDGHLYVFPAGGCGTATCAATWTASLGAAVNEPSVAGSVLFVTTRDGHLYAFNAAGCGQSTCSPLLSISVGNVIPGAAAISGGRVFVTDYAGILHAYALP